MRLGRGRCRRIARGEIFVDLLSDCPELTLLELGDPDPAPTFGGANERGIINFRTARSPKACGMTPAFARAGFWCAGAPHRTAVPADWWCGSPGAGRAGNAVARCTPRSRRRDKPPPTAGPWRMSMRCRRAANGPVLARRPGKTPRHGP